MSLPPRHLLPLALLAAGLAAAVGVRPPQAVVAPAAQAVVAPAAQAVVAPAAQAVVAPAAQAVVSRAAQAGGPAGTVSLPGPGSSGQAVAVAYLDPDIVLSLDVVSGRLSLSSDAVGFAPQGPAWNLQRPDHAYYSGVVGIYDPLDHRLYRYRDGIPGYAPGSAGDAASALVSAGSLPSWTRPSVSAAGGRLTGLRFPDRRRVLISTDASGRVSGLRWPAAHGESLRTTISYRGNVTSITDAFGVTRTYEHAGPARAFELVPALWRRGPGYRHWIAPVLDGARETGWIQHRTTVQHPHPRMLINGLQPFAGRSFAGVSFDSPANGGYLDLNLSSLAQARSLEREMLRRGLLDVTAIRPTFDSTAQIDRIDRALGPRLMPMVSDCHLEWGEGAGPILLTVSTTLTAAERAMLGRAMQGLGAWAVVATGGNSVCATMDARASTLR